jgi:hypothetical protein
MDGIQLTGNFVEDRKEYGTLFLNSRIIVRPIVSIDTSCSLRADPSSETSDVPDLFSVSNCRGVPNLAPQSLRVHHIRRCPRNPSGIMSWKSFQDCIELVRSKHDSQLFKKTFISARKGSPARRIPATSIRVPLRESHTDIYTQGPNVNKLDEVSITPQESTTALPASLQTARSINHCTCLICTDCSEASKLAAWKCTQACRRTSVPPTFSDNTTDSMEANHDSIDSDASKVDQVQQKDEDIAAQAIADIARIGKYPSSIEFRINELELKTISANIRNKEQNRKYGGLTTSFDEMQNNSIREPTQTRRLRVLTDSIADTSDSRGAAAPSGTIDFLLELLQRKNVLSPVVAERVLDVLFTCCSDCGVAESSAVHHDGIGEVNTFGLELNKSSLSSQVLGLGPMNARTNDIPENILHVIETGGVHFILATMRKFREELSVQGIALRLLEVICADSPAIRKKTGAFGGMRDVVVALRFGSGSADIVRDACGCIRYLAFEKENRARAEECNCAQTIMDSVEKVRHSPSAVESALLAISNLIFDNEKNKMAVVTSGGISAVVAMMTLHNCALELVSCACRVLRNLSDSLQSVQKLCFENRAVEAVATAMKRNIGHSGIQEHGAAMLINMMSGYCKYIRDTAIDEHLHISCELHALCADTYVQVSYLQSELSKWKQSPGLIAFFRRKSTASEELEVVGSSAASPPDGKRLRKAPHSSTIRSKAALKSGESYHTEVPLGGTEPGCGTGIDSTISTINQAKDSETIEY